VWVWIGIYLSVDEEDVLVDVVADFEGDGVEGALAVWKWDRGEMDVKYVHAEYYPEDCCTEAGGRVMVTEDCSFLVIGTVMWEIDLVPFCRLVIFWNW